MLHLSCEAADPRASASQLDEALKALTQDLRHASQTIQSDLDRFQRQKVTDIKEMCLDFARFHREWAAKVRSLTPALDSRH